jgi:polysaccharide biosynthesis transport protein
MDQIQIRRLLAVLKRQWWVILQAVLIVGIAAAFLAQRAPEAPFYAEAVLAGQPEITSVTSTGDTMEPFLRAQSQTLRSVDFLSRVAPNLEGETALSLRNSLNVYLNSSAGTIVVRATSIDPERPLLIVNAVSNEFVNSRLNDLTSSLRARTDELQRGIDGLQTTINDINTQISVATAAGQDTSVLTARKETALTQYSSLFSNQQELFNQISLKRRPVALLEPATVLRRGLRPSPTRNGLLGAAIGFVFGLALITLRELLDDKVRRRDQVETETGLTVLAELPEVNIKNKLRELPVIDHPQGGLAESMRGLRTALTFVGHAKDLGALAVTSPQPGDGKTMTAANLALVYAQSGVRTILVSGDLRNPALDALMGMRTGAGLSDLLTKLHGYATEAGQGDFDFPTVWPDEGKLGASVSSLLRPGRVPLLQVLPAGPLIPNPGELLASEAARRVIQELRKQAELVIVDCPPMLVADAAVIADLVDGTIVVVSLNRTRRRRLKVALERLSGAHEKIIGIVINRTSQKSGFYGGYYPYSPNGLESWRPWRRRPKADLS